MTNGTGGVVGVDVEDTMDNVEEDGGETSDSDAADLDLLFCCLACFAGSTWSIKLLAKAVIAGQVSN